MRNKCLLSLVESATTLKILINTNKNYNKFLKVKIEYVRYI